MFLHLSVILFTGGGLCPSMHHRSHDQGGLSGGSLSREVSVQRGLCLEGGSLSGGLCRGNKGDPPKRDPPYGNERAVRIYWNAFLFR